MLYPGISKYLIVYYIPWYISISYTFIHNKKCRTFHCQCPKHPQCPKHQVADLQWKSVLGKANCHDNPWLRGSNNGEAAGMFVSKRISFVGQLQMIDLNSHVVVSSFNLSISSQSQIVLHYITTLYQTYYISIYVRVLTRYRSTSVNRITIVLDPVLYHFDFFSYYRLIYRLLLFLGCIRCRLSFRQRAQRNLQRAKTAEIDRFHGDFMVIQLV